MERVAKSALPAQAGWRPARFGDAAETVKCAQVPRGPMRAPAPGSLAAVALALLLAGCSDAGGGPADDAPAAFDDLDVSSGKGVLRGIVITPAVVPVEGATVRLAGQDLEQATDADGAFVFTELAPGTYFLQVSKPGWTEVQQSAEVLAGVADPPIVKAVIEEIPGAQPRAVTLQLDGFLACSVGTPVSFMSCDATGADRPTLWFDIEGTPQWIQTEVMWASTQPSGDWLYVVQGICSCDGGIPDVGGARFDETADARSPYIARADPEFLDEHGVGSDDGKQLVVAVSASGPEPETTNGSGVALNQEFTVYATFFYNLEPDPSWSFVANGAYPVPDA